VKALRTFSRTGAGDVYVTDHGERLYNTVESARLMGVSEGTIRSWRSRGILQPQGVSELGHALHTAAAVRQAEKVVRECGIRRAGVDPRLLRGRKDRPRKRASALAGSHGGRHP
jgi:DNA-binding transcriptional MerR regulator